MENIGIADIIMIMLALQMQKQKGNIATQNLRK